MATALRRRATTSRWAPSTATASSALFGCHASDVIRSGSFASVQELVEDINAYLDERNANPRPYKWNLDSRTKCNAAERLGEDFEWRLVAEPFARPIIQLILDHRKLFV